ncbi:hypothetical protein V5799_016075 [Amblyomma americanum]|uniref:Fe2OG dioxygenase domain-containing protein n=1 Tax=Amblyomma americanum TaxID=6943 RepID=A0AAQ4F621_AMBAM
MLLPLRSAIYITVVLPVAVCSSDLFTSTQDMQESIDAESTALEDGRFFLLLQEHLLYEAEALHEKLQAIVRRRGGHEVLGTFLSVSSLAAFGIYSSLWKERPVSSRLRAAFSSPSLRKWWPADSDVTGAAAGICKLQQVYDIPATEMAAMKSRLLPAASAEDLKEVARGCYSVGPFGNTTAWSCAALQIASILDSGRSRKLQLGLRWLQDNDKRWPRLRRSRMSHRPLYYPGPPDSDVGEYKSVCVQEGDLRPSGGRLFCTMSTNYGDPRLILQPYKIEVLSLQPRIVVFPGFLSSAEVDYIRAAARKGFKRAGIYSPTNVLGSPSWKRIGKRLTRRITTATSLSLESAEAYQVSNYGLGGHYTPHTDAQSFEQAADKTNVNDGARLATVIAYLTDVEAGGATAFTHLGIGVKPRVGDALFWYDMEPYDGSEAPIHFSFWHQKRRVDERTEHVGCPVLSGSKWITTKWIRERTNVIVRYNTPG